MKRSGPRRGRDAPSGTVAVGGGHLRTSPGRGVHDPDRRVAGGVEVADHRHELVTGESPKVDLDVRRAMPHHIDTSRVQWRGNAEPDVGTERLGDRSELRRTNLPAHSSDDLADQMAVGIGVIGVAGARFPPGLRRRQRPGHPIPLPEIRIGQRLADRRYTRPVAQGLAERDHVFAGAHDSGQTETTGSSRPMRPWSTRRRARRATNALPTE